jgi:uncharacterized protein (DUF934 family)
MQIIKDKQLIENHWRYIKDKDPLTSGDITVSLTRWCEEQALLQNHPGLVGVRINSDENINRLKKDMTRLPLIELYFPVFTDGRGFSQAKLLRKNLNYQGSICAVGHYMGDQVYYLARVGVNSFWAENSNDLMLYLNLLNDFSVQYQS